MRAEESEARVSLVELLFDFTRISHVCLQTGTGCGNPRYFFDDIYLSLCESIAYLVIENQTIVP